MDEELYEKITRKKEFSQLPRKDVEIAMEKFGKKNLNDYQQLKLIRQFLRKIFSSFSSRKVFSSTDRDSEWYLMKHKSTKERFPHYKEVYERCFKDFKKFSVIDLGAGINGLTMTKEFLPKNVEVDYIGIEAIGQFVDLMKEFFKKNKIDAKAEHLSLFETEKIKKIIEESKKPRIVLLFKVIDSLESVERDYSKKLLKEISPISDGIVVSFATRSLGNRKKFSAQRTWIVKFITENFDVVDDFEIGGERYIVFKKHN